MDSQSDRHGMLHTVGLRHDNGPMSAVLVLHLSVELLGDVNLDRWYQRGLSGSLSLPSSNFSALFAVTL
jgi:hypothetical protein